MKQRPTRKGKDAEVMGQDSFFAIQKEWQALYERLLFLARFEAMRDRIIRPVEPDEPDTEVEVGYSRNPLEPLTIVYRNRRVELTKTLYILFRYINDLYRTEEQTNFDFAELSAAVSGDELEISKGKVETMIRRLVVPLEKIRAPFTLKYKKEVLYIRSREEVSEQRELDLTAGEEKANRRGQNITASRKNATRGNVASHV